MGSEMCIRDRVSLSLNRQTLPLPIKLLPLKSVRHRYQRSLLVCRPAGHPLIEVVSSVLVEAQADPHAVGAVLVFTLLYIADASLSRITLLLFDPFASVTLEVRSHQLRSGSLRIMSTSVYPAVLELCLSPLPSASPEGSHAPA